MNEVKDPALVAQEAEMQKLGLKPSPEYKEDDEELDSDDETRELDGDDEVEEEDSKDEDDDSDDSKDSSEEDEDEEEDKADKKHITFKQFNEIRSDLRKANATIAEMATKNAELEAKLPDDFNERVDALAKEIGVEDPEGLKKITNLMKEVMKGQTSGLEKKLSDLEAKFAESTKVDVNTLDEFPKEYDTFEKDFTKEFPNATPAELKEVKKLMHELSHTKGIGGKTYTDKDGNELIDPYSLDYILFKNKDKFEEIVSTRKSRGMEDNQTQGITRIKKNEDSEIKVLPKGASMEQIRAYERQSSRAIADGGDGLRSSESNTI